MVPTQDAEADDVALVVKDLQPLGAVDRREAGDDANLSQGSDVAVAEDDVAALDEVFVCLRVVEAADDGPHGGDGGGDLLRDGGAALVGADGVVVVASDVVGYLGGGGVTVGLFTCGGGGCGGRFGNSLKEKGGFWKIGMHFHKAIDWFVDLDRWMDLQREEEMQSVIIRIKEWCLLYLWLCVVK